MVVEVILQLLVGIVDAELLKAVVGKVLKAKNVQNTDGQALESREVFINWASVLLSVSESNVLLGQTPPCLFC